MDSFVSAFGKIPRMGDFVRARSGQEPTASFEGWIQESMAYGDSKRGSTWPSIYSAGTIQAFVFRPPKKAKSQSVFAGVIRPSHDAVGRRFPIVIGSAIPESVAGAAPHLLPLQLGEFFESATSAAVDADHLGTLEEFEHHIGRLSPPRLDGSATSEYERWAWHTQLWTAWNAIYGDGYSLAPLFAIETIVEAIKPFQGSELPATSLSVRCPLGGAGVAAAVFWLDLVRRAARWKSTVPTFFWHFDGNAGTMLIQLGDTPTSSLGELWAPDPSSDYVCDLTSPPRNIDAQRILASLPRAVSETLQHPEGPVADLLGALLA